MNPALAGLSMIGAVLGIDFLKRLPNKSEWCVFDPTDGNIRFGPDPEGDGSDADMVYETKPVFCSKFYQEALLGPVPHNPEPDGPHVWQGRNVYGTERWIECDLETPTGKANRYHGGYRAKARLQLRTLPFKRDDGLWIGEVVGTCTNRTQESRGPGSNVLSGIRRKRR